MDLMTHTKFAHCALTFDQQNLDFVFLAVFLDIVVC